MDTVREILSLLFPYLPGMITVSVLFILALLAVAGILLAKARKKAKAAKEADADADAQGGEAAAEAPAAAVEDAEAPARKKRGRALSMKASFTRALRLLRAGMGGRQSRYRVPWFLMMGQSGAGKTSALVESGLGQAMGGAAADLQRPASRLNWWFFDRGVVLDAAGDMVLAAEGTGGDRRGFDRLLRLLQKHRHQKPLDGIVLAVPADQLLGPPEDLARRIKEADNRAGVLFDRLKRAQQVLGLRLPVYLLVTKCDKVEGFDEYCRDLPRRLRDDMLGWAAPYGADAAYSPDWADEAFASLARSLHENQAEIFASSRRVERPDRLFLFPPRFQAMFEPLRAYMNRLFQGSVYHESFLFRGVWFSGRCETAREAAPAGAGPVFLRHFFEKKVFPERSLSRPARSDLVSRNRAVLALQASAAAVLVVWGLGLLLGASALRTNIQELTPLLRNIAQDVSREQQEGGLGSTSGYGFLKLLTQPGARINFEQSALNLFEGMSNLRANSLRSVFLPGSWFSPVHGDIRRSMTVAYDQVILKAMFVGLIQKVKQVVQTQDIPQELPPAPERFMFPEETPEFKSLSIFLEELDTLERHVDIYNGLKDSDDLQDVARMAEYLFGFSMPKDFFSDAEYYMEALGEAEYRTLRFRVFRIKTRAKFRKLLHLFYQRTLEQNPVPTAVDTLEERLGAFDRMPEAEKDRLAIATLLAAINDVRLLLGRPEYAWLSNAELDYGPEFQQLLASARGTPMIGEEYVAEHMDAGQERYHRLKDSLGRAESAITGPLLDRADGTVVLQLSQGVASLHDSLGDFSRQRFMEPESEGALRAEAPAGYRLTWNVSLLQEALKLAEPYERFLAEKLPAFPAAMQDTMRRTGRKHLEGNMIELLSRAQGIESGTRGVFAQHMEKEARLEVANFREAMPHLLLLMETFERLEMVDSYIELSKVVDGQAYSMLDLVDYLLDKDGLYRPRGGGFSWWNGKEPAAFEAFGAGDREELEHYLELQRRRIRHLAYEYAEPLVTYFLNRTGTHNEYVQTLAAKWERILRELDRYDSKQPDSSIVRLENLILYDLNEVSLANFDEQITEEMLDARSSDFFLARRNRLVGQLHDRCLDLAQNRFAAVYAELSSFFNEKLAGRFPFSRSGPDPDGTEARPEDVRDLFAHFDSHLETGVRVLSRNTANIASGSDVLSFVKQLREVRAFFEPYLEAPPYEEPRYLLETEFRTHKESEQGGQNVIEWRLEVGSQSFRYMGEQSQGVWRLGEPVKLTLRWARNSPVIPLDIIKYPAMQVQDRTVTLNYRNTWSLLWFLREHRATLSDFVRNKPVRPHALKVVVNTAHQGAKVEDERTDQVSYQSVDVARLFLRVGLSAPPRQGEEKAEQPSTDRQWLELPYFPAWAPELKLKSSMASAQ